VPPVAELAIVALLVLAGLVPPVDTSPPEFAVLALPPLSTKV
jgi:hypothetical protein